MIDHGRVPDIAPDQVESPVIADVGQVGLGTGAAESVQGGDQDLRVGAEPVSDEG